MLVYVLLISGSGKPASHPMGTTVTIKDFLKGVPVRRQTALKEKAAASQLAKIKATMQAYALARPCTRFTLRILKAKSDKGNFSYAPKSVSTERPDAACIRETAIKILGTKAVDGCKTLTLKASIAEGAESFQLLDVDVADLGDTDDFLLHVLIPSPGATHDFAGVEKPRQYISIDGRPVSTSRGIFKQIIKKFKKAFSSAMNSLSAEKTNDPVMCMHIYCRRGSYDANVEPAKDDVLFEDPDYLLRAVDYLLVQIYGDAAKTIAKQQSGRAANEGTDPGLLLTDARKGSRIQTPHAHNTGEIHGDEGTPMSDHQARHLGNGLSSHKPMDTLGQSSMYDDGEEADECDSIVEEEMRLHNEAQEDDCSKDVSISNPFAIAKMNAAMRKSFGKAPTQEGNGVSNGLPTPQRQRGDIQSSPNANSSAGNIYAQRASPTFVPPSPEASSPPPFPFPHQLRNRRLDGSPSRRPPSHVNGSLELEGTNPWQRVSPSLDPSFGHEELEMSHTSYNRQLPQYVPPRAVTDGTPLGAIPSNFRKLERKARAQRQGTNALKKPFISPVHDPQKVWFDVADRNNSHSQRDRSRNALAQPTSQRPEAINLREIESVSSIPEHPDLAETMQYEARKQQALQNYKQQKISQTLLAAKLPSRPVDAPPQRGLQIISPPSSSPHRNRYLKAKEALQPSTTHSPINPPPQLAPDDPRSILIRERGRHPTDGDQDARPRTRTGKRARTAMLPLETVKESDSVRSLQLKVQVSVDSIAGLAKGMMQFDSYVAEGGEFEGLAAPSELDIRRWEKRLERLVRERCVDSNGSESEFVRESVKIDLSFLLDREGSVSEHVSPTSA